MQRELADIKSTATAKLESETKMRLEENASIKKDLARLRVDIQSLLSKKQPDKKTFIKQPTNDLNRWGVYQCYR